MKLKEIISKPFISMSGACEKMVMLHFDTFHLSPAPERGFLTARA